MSDNLNLKNRKFINDDDELDVLAVIKTIWESKKTVKKVALVFLLIGLFVAVFSDKEYNATTTIIPQSSEGISVGGGLGGLGGLAAMAGINLNGLGNETGILPDLFPEILNSIPFQKEILNTPLSFEGFKEKITYREYYTKIKSKSFLGITKRYTIGLPRLIINKIKGKPKVMTSESVSLLSINYEEEVLIKQLEKQLWLEINSEDYSIVIYGSMPEPLAAAELTQRAQELLQDYVINFKVQKSTEQLTYIQDRLDDKKEEFEIIQQKLAAFKDRNKNVNSSKAIITLEQLESEYDLAYSVYAQLAKNKEAQKLQVMENTPVFTILKPVTIPLRAIKPNRKLILALSTIIGIIIGSGIVLVKLYFEKIKKHWNEV